MNQQLHDPLSAIAEVFVADGAADEHRAGQLMHPSADMAGRGDNKAPIIQTLPKPPACAHGPGPCFKAHY